MSTSLVDAYATAARQAEEAVQALGAAASALPFPVSAAVATAAATEANLWSDTDREFGMLSSADVARGAGSRARANLRSLAAGWRRERRILGVKRARGVEFPGFQFDETGTPRPEVSTVWQTLDAVGWGETSVLEWFLIPTGWVMDQSRPVDLLLSGRTTELLQAATATAESEL